MQLFKSFLTFVSINSNKLPKSSITKTNMIGIHMDSPSAERNKAPIYDILSSKVLPQIIRDKSSHFKVLEVAGGVGVHTIFFAENLLRDLSSESSELIYYPSDPDESSNASTKYRIDNHPDPKLKGSVKDPRILCLDETGFIGEKDGLEQNQISLMLNINMIHISKWTATIGLMKEASRLLVEDGILYTYGPYLEGGTSVESNL